ncbi:MAG: DUF5916 domain-containing protein [Litorilituus sp.]|jgi:hypothetical protein|nr:DUF5916 domain-containing protein [Litorilituus sp.]
MPFLFKLISLITFLTVLVLNSSFAQTLKKSDSLNNTYIPRTQGIITIDADLSEPQWQTAKRVNINIVTRPYNNTKSPVDTHALLLEDGKTLYIAFIAQDPQPSEIRAFLKDRDKSWGDDLVGVKLDTYHDQRTAYRFLVNPLGVQIDGIESEVTKRESDAWDGIWPSAGKITKQGYLVEMALPLRMLNFDESKTEQTWGIELMRFYPRAQSLRLSNITLDRGNSCELCQLATATGFSGAKQGSNITITPAVVINETQELNQDNNKSWQKETTTEPSLDLRWGITPDLLLNATINPDFSTIETDNTRLNINNNFALFFDEKRPFFLDNQDYFDSNYNLIYTRNINAPNYGAKLTGRHQQHAFGLFLTDDADTNILISGNRSSTIATIAAESKAAALRYRNNINDEITLGWTSTLRTSEDYSNSVHGVDARFRLSTEDVIKFQALYSKTQYPENLFEQFCGSDNLNDCYSPSTSNCDLTDCEYSEPLLRTINSQPFTGNAVRVSYDHSDSHWQYFVRYNKQNQGFRGDLGFISRVDFNRAVIGGSRKWYAEQGQWWTKFKVSTDWDISHNDHGELIEEEYEVHAHLNANYNSYFRLSYITRDQVGARIDKSSLTIDGNTTLFNENSIKVFGEIKPMLGLQLNAHISFGDAIDFSSNRLGKRKQTSSRIKWNINKNIEVNLKQTYQELDAENDKVFIARLTDFKTNYQFNIQSYIRLRVIYNNTHRNENNYLYIAPENVHRIRKDFSTEVLYAYKINPQTVFYLGYTDHHTSQANFSDIKQDTRSAFMKFSYAWVK